MIKSDSIKELATALSKAQGEMRNPLFDSVNPHYKSRYSSLAAVRNAVVPILAKHGLSIMQEITTTETGVRCGVILMHESGEFFQFDPMDVPATKADAQGFVSAATYAKRTTLQSAVCVVGDADDDGNQAAEVSGGAEEKKDAPGKPAPKEQEKGTPTSTATLKQDLTDLVAMYSGMTGTPPEDILFGATKYEKDGEVFGFKEIRQLTKEWQLKKAILKIEAAIEEVKEMNGKEGGWGG